VLKNIVESVKLVGPCKETIICPGCGACMGVDDYPRDIVIKEKIKLLKELAEKFYKIAESLTNNLNDADKTAEG